MCCHVGCIFAELLTGKALLPGKTQHDQLWLTLKTVGNLTDRQGKVMMLDSSYKVRPSMNRIDENRASRDKLPTQGQQEGRGACILTCSALGL